MKRQWQRLADEHWDLLVIGGGITGAGIARDAALRGFKVGLVDRGDFAGGASSASSKLIHGGLRYLEQAAFGLVAQASHERWLLQQLAPHLVRPRQFLFPVYRADPRGRGRITLGLWLYDRLAGRQRLQPHHRLDRAETQQLEPGLNPEELIGGFLYTDCQTNDARFCLDTLQHAAQLGAVCANYLAVTGFAGPAEQPTAARLVDPLTGATFQVRARVFVNATGPWADRVPGSSVQLSPTKGVHLVLPRLTREQAVTFQGDDGRVLFLLPWGEDSILGTTDTPFHQDPATVSPELADAEYLLRQLRRIWPAAVPVITAFAGVRPLLGSRAQAGRRSREHRLIQETANIFSVAGGKYTTFRLMAQQVVDRVQQQLGRSAPCRTDSVPLPSFAAPAGVPWIGPVTRTQVVQACREEMALTLMDVMRRRTGLALSRHGTPAAAAQVAEVMALELGWSPAQTQAQVADYQRAWAPAALLGNNGRKIST